MLDEKLCAYFLQKKKKKKFFLVILILDLITVNIEEIHIGMILQKY